MRFSVVSFCFCAVLLAYSPTANALGFLKGKKVDNAEVSEILTPHKALYDINLVATRSGSQVINISGKMFYEWKPTCDASFNFSARRKRDNNLYQELRGKAVVADKGGEATFTMPDDLNFDLRKGAMFPMTHTVEMVKHAKNDKKFFQAVVFDGSDDEGPVEINTFIGKPANALSVIKPSDELDMTLLNTPAWNVRMAVFPTMNEESCGSSSKASKKAQKTEKKQEN